jgi:hypothetical protein
MQLKRRNRKFRAAAPIGGVFVLLAIIGVATVIIASLRLTATVLDNSSEKERFGKIIQPVIMFDPVPFESPADIPMQNLLLYSMWTALTSERARNYTYGETQELMVPASDLDVAAATLFGSGVTLEHRSFGDYDNAYTYDKESKVYAIQVSAQFYVYTPDVREITKEGDLYCLDVYYVPPGNAWNLSPAGDKMSPLTEKHMLYYMSKDGDNYHLVKIQDPPSATTAESSASQSSASSSSGESTSQ